MRAVAAARERRLRHLVDFARLKSPLYRDLYAGISQDIQDAARLPVTTKAQLMARFDDWVTDPAVDRASVETFLADRTRIGDKYSGRYLLWKSSGTTGETGIFLQDESALDIYGGLLAVQLASPDLVARCISGSLLSGGRAALIAATGDHFASIASWERVCRSSPGMAARGFSVMEPLDALVTKLNAFRPAYLASYPTMLALLAEEQRAGRLRIDPSLLWSGGECLPPGTLDELEGTFGCRVINEYGASECLSIGFGCSEGWLHVNADWVIVEPVDAQYRPTPPGETSHTVLITNLANRVQPIIRYDLGDAIVLHPGRCACGNALPAIRVEGRRDDNVVLHDSDREARIPPMALTTVLEEATDVHRFQIVQHGPECLLLRFSAGNRERAFRAGAKALHHYLAAQGVAGTRIVLDDREPVPDARSGKLRQVIVEAPEPRDEGAKAPLAMPGEARLDRISSRRAAGRTHGHRL
jgi:phenylacetate-CoA ligase